MHCAYHPQNFAVVACNNCGRALCPACDHRIRGFPFCQDCIVNGIELLQQQQTQASATTTWRKPSPFLAAVLSLVCPGLGAAYNGQLAKALTHFAVFIALFQLAIVTRFAVFVFGFLGIWLFETADAWRSAQMLKAGRQSNNDVLTKKFSDNSLLWAISLITLGTIFVLYTTFDVKLPLDKVLPALLIGFGCWWLISVIRQRRNARLIDSNQRGELDFDAASVGNVSNIAEFRQERFSNR